MPLRNLSRSKQAKRRSPAAPPSFPNVNDPSGGGWWLVSIRFRYFGSFNPRQRNAKKKKGKENLNKKGGGGGHWGVNRTGYEGEVHWLNTLNVNDLARLFGGGGGGGESLSPCRWRNVK